MSALEIKFDCPECGEGLVIDRRAVGHEVACPFCKDPITVPDLPDPGQVAEGSLSQPPTKQQKPAAPSLEDLANERPETPAPSTPAAEKPAAGAPAKAGKTTGAGKASKASKASKGGLPPKRQPGEKPRATAESAEAVPGRPIPPTMPPKPPPGAPPVAPPAAAVAPPVEAPATAGPPAAAGQPAPPAGVRGERRSRRRHPHRRAAVYPGSKRRDFSRTARIKLPERLSHLQISIYFKQPIFNGDQKDTTLLNRIFHLHVTTIFEDISHSTNKIIDHKRIQIFVLFRNL